MSTDLLLEGSERAVNFISSAIAAANQTLLARSSSRYSPISENDVQINYEYSSNDDTRRNADEVVLIVDTDDDVTKLSSRQAAVRPYIFGPTKRPQFVANTKPHQTASSSSSFLLNNPLTAMAHATVHQEGSTRRSMGSKLSMYSEPPMTTVANRLPVVRNKPRTKASTTSSAIVSRDQSPAATLTSTLKNVGSVVTSALTPVTLTEGRGTLIGFSPTNRIITAANDTSADRPHASELGSLPAFNSSTVANIFFSEYDDYDGNESNLTDFQYGVNAFGYYLDMEYVTHICMLSLIMLIIIVNAFAVLTLSYGIHTPVSQLTIRTIFFTQRRRRGSTSSAPRSSTVSNPRSAKTISEPRSSSNSDPFGQLSASNAYDFLDALTSPKTKHRSKHLAAYQHMVPHRHSNHRTYTQLSAHQLAHTAQQAAAAAHRRRMAIAGSTSLDDIPNMDCSTFPYLLSLAMSDMLIGVVIAPLQFETFRQNGHWELGPLLCDLWRAADIFFCTCSALHTAVIAVDRWWTISKSNNAQFRYRRKFNMQRTMLIFPWFLSAMVSFPVMFVWQIEAPDAEEKRRNVEVCEPVMDNVYIMLSAMVSFFLPLATTISFYVQVACGMRRRLAQLKHEAGGLVENSADLFMSNHANAERAKRVVRERTEHRRRAQKRIHELKQHRSLLKSMAIVVLFYCICWAPLYTTLFIQAVCSCPEAAWDFWLSLFTWLGYANSAVNPIIYFCTLQEFRLLAVTLVKLMFKYITDYPIILFNKCRYARYRSSMASLPSRRTSAAVPPLAINGVRLSSETVDSDRSPCKAPTKLMIEPSKSAFSITSLSHSLQHREYCDRNSAMVMLDREEMSTITIVETKSQSFTDHTIPFQQVLENSATETTITSMGSIEITARASSPLLNMDRTPHVYEPMVHSSLIHPPLVPPPPPPPPMRFQPTSSHQKIDVKKSKQNSKKIAKQNGDAKFSGLFKYYDEWGRPVNSSSKEASI